jgi:hypothetical protein
VTRMSWSVTPLTRASAAFRTPCAAVADRLERDLRGIHTLAVKASVDVCVVWGVLPGCTAASVSKLQGMFKGNRSAPMTVLPPVGIAPHRTEFLRPASPLLGQSHSIRQGS